MRTSFHHQPEAQHPIFQLSTSWQADYPIFRGQSGHLNAQMEFFRFWTQSGHWLCAARIVSILSKASVSGDAMLSSELGNRYAATRVHHAGGARAAADE